MRNLLLILLIPLFGYSQNSDIKPYVDFLKKVEKKSAKDYIIEQFKEHDIIILCERDHSDISQYELIKEILSDEYFKKNVKNVFTEIGVINLQPEITDFLKTRGLDSIYVEEKLNEFQQNSEFYPVWDRYNYHYFLKTIYDINDNSENQISLYPSDSEFDWKNVKTVEDYTREYEIEIEPRDSLIASNIINKYQKISSDNKKALIILNIRHAYKVHSHYNNGAIQQNTGKYLSDYFGKRAFFVLSNRPIFYTEENKLIYELIQDGKWDASFKFLEIDNTGFDLKNSIFGNDDFDLQKITNVDKYNDVFDGFVFYKNIENHELIDGYEGFISKDFKKELVRRYTIFFKYMENERILKNLENEESIQEIIKELNTKRYRKYRNFDFLIKSREKHLTD
ncbi:hypothetical protein FNB79_11900 [Formosa sediminum]|uniref:Uncharacterized protein n=1 Tax=Formosa sediminum TaxID=2594004 RepID=A0A516GSY0_9FLAO|nr:hypothetical protein [Formosa sediminum]QDO94631.1 hypothetical protein FNB79_11900 [Formosa sediminum]